MQATPTAISVSASSEHVAPARSVLKPPSLDVRGDSGVGAISAADTPVAEGMLLAMAECYAIELEI